MIHLGFYEEDITGRCVRTMKKQIQLYYDPEDETYKTLISAKNKTCLLDVCYKFSVEFYKCQMKEVNPDSEEVICYLIAMMYLLRQGGSLPGIAVRGAGSMGEWLQERVSSTDAHWSADIHQSTSTHQAMDTYQPASTGQQANMHPPAGTDQPTGMHQSAGMGQPAGMHQPMDLRVRSSRSAVLLPLSPVV